jgi:xylulokinase
VSLVGIDVGTSAVKLAAFDVDGGEMASVRKRVGAEHPAPGQEILDPEQVWQAVATGLDELRAQTLDDPPAALAISASGDEVFPVAGGRAVGPCLLSGDTRGAEVEAQTLARYAPEEWLRRCGHVPARMDPVNRVLWWRAQHPDVADRADAWLGWHEYLSLRLCGRAVTDPGLAAKWLVFDLRAGDWSDELLSELELPREQLPEVLGWGEIAGRERGGAAVAVGSYDSSCAALGSGVTGPETHGLACGSWEVLVAPADVAGGGAAGGLAAAARAGASVIPYPGTTGFAAVAQSPDGSSVLEWAAAASGHSIESLEPEPGAAPTDLVAVPHISGARGAIVGLSLATSARQMAQALMEGVAFDLATTVDGLRAAGIEARAIRAAGGGTRSPWWMQLKATLTGVPLEVVEQEEPGALGAALLAGCAAGEYGGPAAAGAGIARVKRRYEPDPEQAARYEEPLARYRETVPRLPVTEAP